MTYRIAILLTACRYGRAWVAIMAVEEPRFRRIPVE
jgi:hypothetical protein